jgi:hypothetical protein
MLPRTPPHWGDRRASAARIGKKKQRPGWRGGEHPGRR